MDGQDGRGRGRGRRIAHICAIYPIENLNLGDTATCNLVLSNTCASRGALRMGDTDAAVGAYVST